ncbi:hypothetical protein OZX56_05935 [Lactobacillus sp. ESL0684]|uniref:hypothetical protein n=1 Tax=Lactobacillus sp. ESL0684 TaxID=2983213 RepID=UPI0023F8DEE3|nr:hypothetical protein [Lactobacillus sp. ESL0684]WEV43086.1 hypothetical protein OZX56_05935 [Lactobacillus sp. ESL0684]
MKSLKKIAVSLATVATIGMTAVPAFAASENATKGDASAVLERKAKKYSAVKYYNFDRNTITGVESNFHNYHYISIPTSSYQTSYKNTQIGGGWNYKAYRHTNYYKGGY